MSDLPKQLRYMLRKARETGEEQHRSAGGVEIAVKANPDRMRLHRVGADAPAEDEVRVYAEQMGWRQHAHHYYTSDSGQRYVVVQDSSLFGEEPQ